MFIRPMVKSDIPFVCQLQRQLFEEDIIYGFVPETEEEIEKSINPCFLAAELNHRIIGFIMGRICVSKGLAVVPKGESYVEVENLYIAAQFRKQGIGGKLLDELLTVARENGAAYAVLYSATKDVRSILKFYERHNFQSWSVQMFQKL
jgi:ribosomal protein S18 acetylase RimI-like enzyme